jgi:hypothetical protein
MKLMFNKENLDGHWFYDDEDTTGCTEKVPQHTNQVFDEELNDWVEKSTEEEEK